MKNSRLLAAFFFLSASVSLSLAAPRASAQGPAGAGAAEAAQETAETPRSLNPVKWFMKDSPNPDDSLGNRADLEQKLTPSLQSQGLLPPNASAAAACEPFTALSGCLTVLHASHNLGIDFICLRAASTGVHTTADVSGCKVPDGDKGLGLVKAIRQFKPDADAKQAAKDAGAQASADLHKITS